MTALAYLLWLVYTVENWPQVVAFEYVAAAGVSLTTKGCDIMYVPGSAPTITYVAPVSARDDVPTKNNEGKVTAVVVRNKDGCDGWPRGACAGKCLVTVTVPPEAEASAFTIRQDGTDNTSPKITITSGTTIGSINMGYDHTKTISAGLTLKPGSTVTGTVSGYLVRGSLVADNAKVGTYEMVTEGGSIHVLDHASPAGSPIEIVYRNGGALCVSTDLPSKDVNFVPLAGNGNAFEYCDIGKALDGSFQVKAITEPLDKLKAVFDGDADGFVSDAEAREALNKLGCFGPDCPFGSDPDPWIYHFGLGATAAVVGTGQITMNQLARNLVDNTDFHWAVPDCPTRVTVASTGVEFSSGTAQSGSMAPFGVLMGNEVHISLKQSDCVHGNNCPARTKYGHTSNGLMMTGGSAATMMKKYASKYGDIGSTGDIFLAMDVTGGPGVPKSRWVYTTSPAYLVLNPMVLAWLLTFGVFQPDIKRQKVVFEDTNCGYTTADYTPAQLEAAYAEIAAQLTQSLKSNPKNKGGAIRGALVMLNEDLPWADTFESRYSYMLSAGDAGDAVRTPWTDDTIYTAVMLARNLSIIAAVLLAVLCLYVTWKFFAYRVSVEYQSRLANRYMLLRKCGFSRAHIKKLADLSPLPQPSWNPFFDIVDIVTSEVVAPMTASCVKVRSLSAFMMDRVRSSPDETFIYMSTFVGLYELYCMQNDLPSLSDHIAVQRALVKDFGLRIDHVDVSRLHGLRWKGPESAYADDTAGPPSPSDFVSPSPGASDEEIILAFLRATCDIAFAPGSFIDMKTRPGPDGKLVVGFQKSLADWCGKYGLTPPDVQSEAINWTKLLPVGVTMNWFDRVVQIRGITPYRIDDSSGAATKAADDDAIVKTPNRICACISATFQRRLERFSAGITARTSISVFLQIAILFVLPMYLLLFVAVNYMDHWGWLNAPGKGLLVSDGRKLPPFGWGDFQRPDFGLSFLGQAYVTVASQCLLYIGVLMALSFPRILISFARPTMSHLAPILDFYCHFHALVVMLYLLCFFFWMSISFAWTLLAACLMPTTVLPIGATYIASVYVGYLTFTRLRERAQDLERHLANAFDKVLQARLKEGLKLLQQELLESGSGADLPVRPELSFREASEGATTLNDSLSGALTLPPKHGDEKVTASDLFLMLSRFQSREDGKDDNRLGVLDIERLFATFDLDVSEKELDQFFAFCDVDGDHRLTAQEFEDGWDQMLKEKLRTSLADVGISDRERNVATLVAVASMILLAVFIIGGINAFTTADGYTATLQTLLISGATQAVRQYRSDLKDESDKGTKELLEEILKKRDAEKAR